MKKSRKEKGTRRRRERRSGFMQKTQNLAASFALYAVCHRGPNGHRFLRLIERSSNPEEKQRKLITWRRITHYITSKCIFIPVKRG
jgi:hypothetical protein